MKRRKGSALLGAILLLSLGILVSLALLHRFALWHEEYVQMIKIQQEDLRKRYQIWQKAQPPIPFEVNAE